MSNHLNGINLIKLIQRSSIQTNEGRLPDDSIEISSNPLFTYYTLMCVDIMMNEYQISSSGVIVRIADIREALVKQNIRIKNTNSNLN